MHAARRQCADGVGGVPGVRGGGAGDRAALAAQPVAPLEGESPGGVGQESHLRFLRRLPLHLPELEGHFQDQADDGWVGNSVVPRPPILYFLWAATP
jgi:hypothetical protein